MGTDSPRDFLPDGNWLDIVERCLAFLPPESRDGHIDQLADHIAKHTSLQPVRLTQSRRGGAAFLLIYPGKLAMVGGVAPASSLDCTEDLVDTADLLKQLLSSVCSEVELAQAVTFPNEFESKYDVWRRRCYERAGLRQVAALQQCSFDFSKQSLLLSERFNSKEGQTSELEFVPWNVSLHSEFVRVVDQTYEGTLDVPELNGVRSTLATLEGYASAGWQTSSQRDWWLVRDASGWVGCLLTCRHSDSLLELLYLGLIPEFRGRGLARSVLHYLLKWAFTHSVKRILLAVDARNEPARKLYRHAGFEEVGIAEAWF